MCPALVVLLNLFCVIRCICNKLGRNNTTVKNRSSLKLYPNPVHDAITTEGMASKNTVTAVDSKDKQFMQQLLLTITIL